MFTKRDISS